VKPPVTDPQEVAAIAAGIAAAGSFALDLEFVSESRYVPDLCLVQVGWGDPADPEVAAVDPRATDPAPLFTLVEDPAVETVLHSAQGDLALLGNRYDVVGRQIVDTQIAAAFLGLGDQVGYAGLVEQLNGVVLDKASQFTDWCRRPLTPEQLRYALDDVRYLPGAWLRMRDDLAARGRLAWVETESARVAADAASRLPPEECYRKVRGWERLDDEGRAAVRALAAWRERLALDGNKPPQWLLKDAVLVDVARRRPRGRDQLAEVKGIGRDALRRHAADILAAVAERDAAPPAPPRSQRLPRAARDWGSQLLEQVRERCREAEVAPRFVATRADVDELVHWWVESGAAGGGEPEMALLTGWRRDLVGQGALDWLAAQAADDGR
jgi:ribonuclease D